MVDESLRDQLKSAIGQINRVERFFCGGLLRRMVTVGLRFDRILPSYGVNGALMLLRARAIQAWMLVPGAAAVVFAALGNGPVAAFLFGLTFALGAVGLAYAAAGGRLGRAWRARHTA